MNKWYKQKDLNMDSVDVLVWDSVRYSVRDSVIQSLIQSLIQSVIQSLEISKE